MKKVTFGIDIGGTNTVFGVVDSEGKCLKKSKIPTPTHGNVDAYLVDLAKALNELKDSITEPVEFMGIGVGAPNGNYYTGRIEFAPNLKFPDVVPLVDLLKKHFDYPVIALTNDANAAAIGEMVYGGAKGMRDFIMVTLGTGLGSGIVANGEMIYGHDGFAGELGHIIAVRDGRQCGCGRKGCLETYASATGIRRTVYELICNTNHESELRAIPFNELTAHRIHTAAVNGDKIALEAFEFTGEILGRALADTIALFTPEAFFLFGGLANAGDYIFNPTLKAMNDNCLVIFKNKTKLLASKLEEGDAAIVGASALVWKELDKKK
jgi:glucokinase